MNCHNDHAKEGENAGKKINPIKEHNSGSGFLEDNILKNGKYSHNALENM